jgi:hypothetical protein
MGKKDKIFEIIKNNEPQLAAEQILLLFDVSSLLIFLDNHVDRSMELLKKDEIANDDAKYFSILGQMTAYNEARKFVKKINNC